MPRADRRALEELLRRYEARKAITAAVARARIKLAAGGDALAA